MKFDKISVWLFFILVVLTDISPAQDNPDIRETSGYEGRILPYITEEAFRQIKINNVLPLEMIVNTDSLESIIAQLGEPMEIQETADTALTGTVIFEYRDVKYPGMNIHYLKYETFKPTRIDITSDNYYLTFGRDRIQVGKLPGQISDVLESAANRAEGNRFTLYILQGDSKGEVLRDEKGSIVGGYRFITFTVNPDTQEISEINLILSHI